MQKASATVTAESQTMEAKGPGGVAATTTTTTEVSKLEKIRLKQEQRKEFLREQKVLLRKELRLAKKLRKQKRLHREQNAPSSAKSKTKVNATVNANEKGTTHNHTTTKKTLTTTMDDEAKQSHQDSNGNRDLDIFQKVFLGHTDDSTGVTTLRLGVQYIDVVVGTGKVLQDAGQRTTKEVVVQYKLTGGKFNTVLDRSSRFSFRWGKGEVIQGWEIGLLGMREGGKRKLIVPPKAGYGSQDIGAGAGAILHFDITLLSC